jgi:hypothetical protein
MSFSRDGDGSFAAPKARIVNAPNRVRINLHSLLDRTICCNTRPCLWKNKSGVKMEKPECFQLRFPADSQATIKSPKHTLWGAVDVNPPVRPSFVPAAS